ncbi:hypothetical protein DBR19_20195 [Aeromonas sp. HMWF014]|nr:hypothetical protein DBR19_20195 [Aeromonas sp. HMWF014]
MIHVPMLNAACYSATAIRLDQKESVLEPSDLAVAKVREKAYNGCHYRKDCYYTASFYPPFFNIQW